MTERLFSLSLVGAQFACVTLALWPFVEWHASAFGLALGSAGGALAIWTLAFNRLGNFNILPEVKSDARLITNGPYAYIRHPMYSALMLLVFGVAGLHANWVNVLAACALVAVLAVKSSVEEKRLEHAFEEYATTRHALVASYPESADVARPDVKRLHQLPRNTMLIDSSQFTPWASLAGGVLIGAAAGALILINGRIAGISGILGGLFERDTHDKSWRIAFILGLIAAPLVWGLTAHLPEATIDAPFSIVVLAGAFVGVGTRLGSGCTSGHGVCGLSRLSVRSLAATVTFMAIGMGTVYLIRHLFI